MKKTEIKIRISEKDKTDFKKICMVEDTTMSNKINRYITNEINDSFIITVNKSVKVALLRLTVGEVLHEMSFTKVLSLDYIKGKIEEGISKYLSFETVVEMLDSKDGYTSGIISFELEDNTPYSINFTIGTNGN